MTGNVYSVSNRKPKRNYKDTALDKCQTPSYAFDPLVPFISNGMTIWEPACGEGNLSRTMEYYGFSVIMSDICLDPAMDFFSYEPATSWDAIVTNPPYSLKYRWLERCYELGKPFALLLPVETLGAEAGQVLFDKYGIQVIFMHPRICFKMPQTGYDNGGAQFPTAWFTWKLDLGADMIFRHVPHYFLPFEKDSLPEKLLKLVGP